MRILLRHLVIEAMKNMYDEEIKKKKEEKKNKNEHRNGYESCSIQSGENEILCNASYFPILISNLFICFWNVITSYMRTIQVNLIYTWHRKCLWRTGFHLKHTVRKAMWLLFHALDASLLKCTFALQKTGQSSNVIPSTYPSQLWTHIKTHLKWFIYIWCDINEMIEFGARLLNDGI